MMQHNFKIALLIIIIAFNYSNAQQFQGQATYSYKMSFDDQFAIKSEKVDDEMQKMLKEQIKKAFEKTYILNFNQTESSYLKEQQLAAPTSNSSGISMSFSTSGDDTALYKNSKTKQYIQEEESMNGKSYLITDNLPTYNWKIEGETKKIGDYDCYKAVAIIKVTPEQTANFEAKKQKEAKLKKPSLYPAKAPQDQTVTAWFTNAIPVSHGPADYWGLPGLILEITAGKTTILCSKLILNPKDKKPIIVPQRGKVITQKAYDAAEKVLYDKMADDNGVIMQSFQK